MHGSSTPAVELPEACGRADSPELMDMDRMQAAMLDMSGHQRALMEGMMATERPMMQGMMAEDPDVAFACAMIPHHQGAILMAQVQLEYGDNAEMKRLAQRIMEDQAREIQELVQLIDEETAKE
jgi:uncharacterized protein (DUF305 family)